MMRPVMLERKTVFEIHRLKDMGMSNSMISRELGIGRDTVSRCLKNPDRKPVNRVRFSVLDPYRHLIDDILKEHPDTPATVIMRYISRQGYTGCIRTLRYYVADNRKETSGKAFIRYESPPGKQMQLDWGYFGTTAYGKRKLYVFAITESYSRMLYLEFTHSQKQAVLHQCLLNAFVYFCGLPDEILLDNMATAVIERHGSLVRFNDSFLDFLRPFKINPVACNARQPQEKGKIERSIKYIRQSFWPLREIQNLADANYQVRQWLDETANVRIHGTTGEKPSERFKGVRLRPLPEHLTDCRDTLSLTAHKDFAVRYDNNFYTVPPWTVGKQLTLKADNKTISIFYKEKPVAVHERCWEHKKRIEIPSHAEQLKRLKNKFFKDRDIAVFASMGDEASDYLEALADASQPIKKNITRLLHLKDEYGEASLIYAITKALKHKAYGADYIENILYQEMTPVRVHPPVKLKNDDLNRIRFAMPLLEEYDAFAIKRSRS